MKTLEATGKTYEEALMAGLAQTVSYTHLRAHETD